MFDIQAVIGWLLAQPAYIQVGASLVFFILVAPVILAAIAIAAERFEGIVAVAVFRYVPLASGPRREGPN